MLKYSNYIIYRGKKIPLNKLKPNSKKKIVITCPKCGVVFERYFSVLNKSGSFLCQKCAIKKKLSKTIKPGTKKNRLTVLKPAEKSGYSIFRCDCGNICEVSNSNFLLDKTKSCGCLRKENIKKVSRHYFGKKHWNWQGGITGERQCKMTKGNYRIWRKDVYKRDNYICQKCGQKGGILNAHHIKDYQGNKDKILDINNGITFCEDCHKEFHRIYGRKKLTREMVNEFCEEKRF